MQTRLVCRYSADRAGQYELAVKSSLDGEPLAGSPFSLTVIPGRLSPRHCTAELAHSASCLTAGAEALVIVRAKDEHGNAVSSSLTCTELWASHTSLDEPLNGTTRQSTPVCISVVLKPSGTVLENAQQ